MSTQDLPGSSRRRQRSAADKKRYWHVRWNAFMKAGFTDKESEWAADNGLSLKDKQVQGVMKHRKGFVKWIMEDQQVNRIRAVAIAADDLESRLDQLNNGEMNLFFEISPGG